MLTGAPSGLVSSDGLRMSRPLKLSASTPRALSAALVTPSQQNAVRVRGRRNPEDRLLGVASDDVEPRAARGKRDLHLLSFA